MVGNCTINISLQIFDKKSSPLCDSLFIDGPVNKLGKQVDREVGSNWALKCLIGTSVQHIWNLAPIIDGTYCNVTHYLYTTPKNAHQLRRGSITVHLTSYFSDLDSTKQVNLLLISVKQSSLIQISQTGGQLHSDTSPCEVMRILWSYPFDQRERLNS